MIMLCDSYRLARAKLHSRRGLLVLTILTSALLFGALYAATSVLAGVRGTISAYNQASFGGQYLVQSTALTPQFDVMLPSEDEVVELRELEKTYIAEQQALAQESGETFDEASMESVLLPSPYVSRAAQPWIVNQQSPVYARYIAQQEQDYAHSASATRQQLTERAATYGGHVVSELHYSALNSQNAKYLPAGVEDLANVGKDVDGGGYTPYAQLTHSVRQSRYSAVDDALLERCHCGAERRGFAAANHASCAA